MDYDLNTIKGRITQPTANDVFFHGLIYGKSGVGKTYLAATKRTGRKTLIVDVERGLTSVAGTGVEAYPARTHQDLQDLFVFLKAEGHKTYDLLVVDSLTQLQKFMVADTLEQKVNKREARDYYRANQDDYALANEKLRRFLWDARSLPLHTIYNCLDLEVPLAEGGVAYTVNLTEKFRDSVLAYSDFVAYLDIVPKAKVDGKVLENVRRLRVVSDGSFVAKVRRAPGLPPLPAHIAQPTLDKLFALLRGKEEKAA